MAVDAAARDGTRRRKSRREAAAAQRLPREEEVEEVVGARGGLVGRRGLNLAAPGYREGAWGSILTGPEARRRPGGNGASPEMEPVAVIPPCCTAQQYKCSVGTWYSSPLKSPRYPVKIMENITKNSRLEYVSVYYT